MDDDAVLKDELGSAVEARKELGDEMEPAVIVGAAQYERLGFARAGSFEVGDWPGAILVRAL